MSFTFLFFNAVLFSSNIDHKTINSSVLVENVPVPHPNHFSRMHIVTAAHQAAIGTVA
ncbi:MAG TPA: hypothetical protein PLY00_12330 [Verrucomicrobiota bacterium]|jgi:hypothetical protein|nr:hypothetical protein [Verrucomicrobiota bacterium]HOF48979.1 hypothetical protein [Verrucomicrobiota bacterium]HOR72056.1 hypothetical protein [Verrucomicrobiota bacterium]HPK99342.1 hypothetical protein [Verrucomicrobiota bacterium]HPV12141.1 hypothetical protein [Verrucomicrobiota bacterium]